jgi:hypothetical protein
LDHFKNKKPIEAIVSKVSPFAVYLDLFGERMQAKLELPGEGLEEVKPGDKLTVRISYLSSSRIVVERV